MLDWVSPSPRPSRDAFDVTALTFLIKASALFFLCFQELRGVHPLSWSTVTWAVAHPEGSTAGMWWELVVKSAVNEDMNPRTLRWCAWQANTGRLTMLAEVRSNDQLTTHKLGIKIRNGTGAWLLANSFFNELRQISFRLKDRAEEL